MILKWEKLYVKNMKCEPSMDRKMSVPSWARLEKRLGEFVQQTKGMIIRGGASLASKWFNWVCVQRSSACWLYFLILPHLGCSQGK